MHQLKYICLEETPSQVGFDKDFIILGVRKFWCRRTAGTAALGAQWRAADWGLTVCSGPLGADCVFGVSSHIGASLSDLSILSVSSCGSP